MDSGYAVTTIYEHMRETGRVKCSYETFRKHVQRFIKAGSALPTPTPPSTDQAKGETTARQERGSKAKKPKPPEPSKKPESAGITGFKFNPKPNKEDLL